MDQGQLEQMVLKHDRLFFGDDEGERAGIIERVRNLEWMPSVVRALQKKDIRNDVIGAIGNFAAFAAVSLMTVAIVHWWG